MPGWRLGQPTTPPPPVPTSPVQPLWAWFDDVGVVESPPGFAQSWADQSGNGRHTTAPVGAAPEYATNVINGLPAVSFNGFGARLENVIDDIPAGDRTIMTVAQPLDIIGGTLLSFRRSTADWAAYLFNLSGNQYLWSDGLTAIQRNGAPVDYTGAARLIEHVQAGNTLSVSVDGVSIPLLTTTTSNENGLGGFILGNREPAGYSQHWFGPVGELLIYDYLLTPAQRAHNVAYLSAKWGVSG